MRSLAVDAVRTVVGKIENDSGSVFLQRISTVQSRVRPKEIDVARSMKKRVDRVLAEDAKNVRILFVPGSMRNTLQHATVLNGRMFDDKN